MFEKLLKDNTSIINSYQKMINKKQLMENVADAPFMENVDDEETQHFLKWKSDVQAKHAGKKMSFKGRVEQGVDTVSAEVPGEDRSYGVWDAAEKKGHVFESDDSGGDTSAYNKFLLAKLGDLPKTKEGYEKGVMEGEVKEGVMDTLKAAGKKVLDTLGHKDDEELLKDLKKKAEVSEELKGDQVKIDKNHNGEVDSEDLAILRKEKVTEEDHSDEEEDKELIRDMVKKDALKEATLMEYHTAGTVNGKSFKIATDDVYDPAQIKAQNPHLSNGEAHAIAAHTETDEFIDGCSNCSSEHGGHIVHTGESGGYHGDVSDTMSKLGLQEDATDTVSMDVPFLIRVMEFAKEDAKTDQDLHFAAEKMVELSKQGPLSMAAYDEVFGKAHAGPDGDNDADDKMAEGYDDEEKPIKDDGNEGQPKKIEEVLTASTPIETWIKDFSESEDPKFEGKSKEKRRQMAIAAYYAEKKK